MILESLRLLKTVIVPIDSVDWPVPSRSTAQASDFRVENDLNSDQGNIRSADPKIESVLDKRDF